MSEENDTVLTLTQQRRVSALATARAVLMQTNMFSQNPTRSVDDLIALSTWILGPEQEREDNPAQTLTTDDIPAEIKGFITSIGGSEFVRLGDGVFGAEISAGGFLADLRDQMLAKAETDEDKQRAIKVLRDTSCASPECGFCLPARDLADRLEAELPTDDGQERPDDTEAGDPGYKYPEGADLEDTMAEPSDFFGGEADTASDIDAVKS